LKGAQRQLVVLRLGGVAYLMWRPSRLLRCCSDWLVPSQATGHPGLAASLPAPLPPRPPQVLKQLSDADKELGEALAAAAAAEGAGEGGEEEEEEAGGEAAAGSDAGSSDVGFGFDQEAFSAAQAEVARRARALQGVRSVVTELHTSFALCRPG
jgi:hypothetical protein